MSVDAPSQEAANAAGFGIGIFLWIVFWGLAFVAYWVPTVIAVVRKHHQIAPIALVNLFFGWTGLGWIGALVWSFSARPAPVNVYFQQQPPPPPL